MDGKVALSCRTGGARQRGEPGQAPVAAAMVPWLRTSQNTFPSCGTRIGVSDRIDSFGTWPIGGAESPKVLRKEASPRECHVELC